MAVNPETASLASREGPRWWAALEADMAAIPCGGCREDGKRLLSAIHDFVNLRLNKPLHDPDNYRMVVEQMQEALVGQESERMEARPIESATRLGKWSLQNWELTVGKARIVVNITKEGPRGIARGSYYTSVPRSTADRAGLGGLFQKVADSVDENSYVFGPADGTTFKKAAEGIEERLNEAYDRAFSRQSPPNCARGQARKVQQCIQRNKDGQSNPWATCQHEAGCTLPRQQRQEFGFTLERMPDIEEVIWELTRKQNQKIKVVA